MWNVECEMKENIKNRAKELGFLGCGIIPAVAFNEYTRYLDERVKTFPESEGMYKPLYANANPIDNAKSIIVCTRAYNNYKIPDSLGTRIGKCYLFDTRIPYSREYRANAEFETYLKTLGLNLLQCKIPDRWAAAKAGLGKFGRNNFIYSPENGSYIWINTWAVDRELEYDPVEENPYMTACNDNCHKCIDACPTKALSAKFSMNRARCVTYFVCSAKTVPDEETKKQLGNWIYGCDACQDACPMNKGKLTGTEDFPLLAEFAEHLEPEQILEMDLQKYKNLINPRFWYSGEEGLWLWKCNALRAMINSGKKKCETGDINGK